MLVNTQEKHIGRSNGFVEILSYGTLQEYYPILMEIFMLYIYMIIFIYINILIVMAIYSIIIIKVKHIGRVVVTLWKILCYLI